MDRGGLTVKEVAAQLGVAEKTIYRRLGHPTGLRQLLLRPPASRPQLVDARP